MEKKTLKIQIRMLTNVILISGETTSVETVFVGEKKYGISFSWCRTDSK